MVDYNYVLNYIPSRFHLIRVRDRLTGEWKRGKLTEKFFGKWKADELMMSEFSKRDRQN